MLRVIAFKYPHDTQKQMHPDMCISIYVRESVDIDVRMWIWMVGAMRGAHPIWSAACAQCRALDSPAALLRSRVRLTPETAGGRAHSALHGTGWL